MCVCYVKEEKEGQSPWVLVCSLGYMKRERERDRMVGFVCRLCEKKREENSVMCL